MKDRLPPEMMHSHGFSWRFLSLESSPYAISDGCSKLFSIRTGSHCHHGYVFLLYGVAFFGSKSIYAARQHHIDEEC